MTSTIARIEGIPVISPAGSANDLDGTTDTVIVKVFDQDGRFGFGEADAPPSAVGIAASAHLAAVAPTCTFIEFVPRELADSALRCNLCSLERAIVYGRVPLLTAPGLGVTLNEEALARFRVT